MRKRIDGVFLALIALALLAGGVYTLWPQLTGNGPTALYYDNRAPEPAPKWSLAGLWTGEDFNRLDS